MTLLGYFYFLYLDKHRLRPNSRALVSKMKQIELYGTKLICSGITDEDTGEWEYYTLNIFMRKVIEFSIILFTVYQRQYRMF